MASAILAEARRLPHVASPRRPGLSALARAPVMPAGVPETFPRPWVARSIAFAVPLFVVVLTCSVAFGSSGQTQESPTEVVRSTLTKVFRILEDETLKDPAKLIPRRHMLEEVIASHFDYTEMSKRSLAAHWVPLTAGERAEFVDLFKGFLSDRYAEKIERYSGEQVAYLSERIEENYAEVRTELRSSKVAIPMDYRLHGKDGTWHAYDLIVDGVSLVKNYRSQFEKIIRSSSYQELVRRLRERTVGEDKEKKASLTTVPLNLVICSRPPHVLRYARSQTREMA
jgi:phospholipid transport system substrate-binding protein